MIKRKVFSLLFLIVLLTACNVESNENDMILEGQSNNWYGVAELNEQDQEDENNYAGELKLSYKGDDPVNDFSYEVLLEDDTQIIAEDDPLDENEEVVTRISCSNCDYSSGEAEIEVTVYWNNQTETFYLK